MHICILLRIGREWSPAMLERQLHSLGPGLGAYDRVVAVHYSTQPEFQTTHDSAFEDLRVRFPQVRFLDRDRVGRWCADQPEVYASPFITPFPAGLKNIALLMARAAGTDGILFLGRNLVPAPGFVEAARAALALGHAVSVGPVTPPRDWLEGQPWWQVALGERKNMAAALKTQLARPRWSEVGWCPEGNLLVRLGAGQVHPFDSSLPWLEDLDFVWHAAAHGAPAVFDTERVAELAPVEGRGTQYRHFHRLRSALRVLGAKWDDQPAAAPWPGPLLRGNGRLNMTRRLGKLDAFLSGNGDVFKTLERRERSRVREMSGYQLGDQMLRWSDYWQDAAQAAGEQAWRIVDQGAVH